MDAAERCFGQYKSRIEIAVFQHVIKPFKRLVYLTTVSIDQGYRIGISILNYIGKSFICLCCIT